ncbi:MAG: chalcone isomerase family protein [Sedimenticola sp.]|nr:chalcone isomerase family protein [Sedimenticola sp.]
MRQWMYGAMVALCLGSTPLAAKEVAGVEIPDASRIAGNDRELLLNGAGVRYKFIFKIYIGALYLPQAQKVAEHAINSPGPKRVLMHFLYDRVEQKDLAQAWREGFEDNHSAAELAALNPRIETFAGLFTDAVEGDRIWIDQLSNGDTRVTINEVEQGQVKGSDFYPALLKIWLGEDPVTMDLKQAILGYPAEKS